MSACAPAYNRKVLRGVKVVQAHAPDGGGYFTGLKAVPPESPIGYPLKLFGAPLLVPPRSTSYCSGATYSAFIEALNLIFPDGAARLSTERAEAMRMQEPDASRRDDGVKFWGYWNSDGFGSQYALVQYSGMGEEVPPEKARPGDFMNISRKSGSGHSVVFLGWTRSEGEKAVRYWSSQKATNGINPQVEKLSVIKELKVVRLTHPERLFEFRTDAPVDTRVPGDQPPR